MRSRLVVTVLACVFVACGPDRQKDDNDAAPDALSECDTENAHRCQGATYQTCLGGQWQTAVDCPTACVDSLGCVQCAPNQTFCQDGNVWVCDELGNPGSELQVCGAQNTCVGGACVDACAEAASSKSYIGCEYWAVDLDNAIEVWGVIGERFGSGPGAFDLTPTSCDGVFSGTVVTMNVCFETQGQISSRGACDPPSTLAGPATCPLGYQCGAQQACISDAQHSPFAIVVSNPHAKDVEVTLTGPGAETMTTTIGAGTVVPILPQSNGLVADQSVDGSSKSVRAYKIASDLPIVAYQFSPLDNVNVFSNDASLLIPRTAFDVDYYAMAI